MFFVAVTLIFFHVNFSIWREKNQQSLEVSVNTLNISKWRISSKKQELLTPRDHMRLTSGFLWSACCLSFKFFLLFVFILFLLSNIACVSGLFLQFSLTFIYLNLTLSLSTLT
jgi:hypothetical protein